MISQNINNKYPKILVISNNSFSDTANNGKTLASFFEQYPSDNIAQLYFNPEIPNSDRYNNYFRVTDKDIVVSVIRKKKVCGNVIDQNVFNQINENRIQNKRKISENLKKHNLTRLIREFFWSTDRWKTEQLSQWLDEYSPDLIFLCAGDSGFAYNITNYIKNKFNTKLIVYITDDYILPRRTLSLFWWLRRNYIFKKMNNAIQESDLFITISEKMKESYYDLFGKESFIAVNMTESFREGDVPRIEESKELTLVYAGGLHFKRYETLFILAQAIKEYNLDSQHVRKIHLKIYSGQKPNKNILRLLNVEEASEYCGELNKSELVKVLNSCDIPVHVESFDKKSIESTKLSISTKIPEYLSLGKPVLAIGPSNVASMEYLDDSAFCITQKKSVYSELKKFVNNFELQTELSNKALLKYEKNHNKEINSEEFFSKISNLYEQK